MSSLKIWPDQIVTVPQQAVSAPFIQNSAVGNFSPKKQRGQRQKQLGCLYDFLEEKLFVKF
jgi:hypothetical protein